MFAKELINIDFPSLSHTDNGNLAMQWMEEYKVTALPVVEGIKYLGILSEDEVLNMSDLSLSLKKQNLSLNPIAVLESEHIYEVLNKISLSKLNIIPIVNKDGNYLGTISLHALINSISKLTSVKDIGGILQLEVNVNDYSLSEIATIVESNDGKILSSYIHTHDDSSKMDVTIKVNKSDLSGIIQTFERYNYTIAAKFHKSQLEDDLDIRYKEFMHFMNI